MDNPVNLLDPNGLDPIREQFGSLSDVLKVLSDNIGKSFWDMSKEFGTGVAGQSSRYVYTEKWGILDLQHVFAADQSYFHGYDIALKRGELYELVQLLGFGGGKKSAFAPEDLPSNLIGAVLGQVLKSGKVTEKNIKVVKEFFESLVVVNPADSIISPDNVYIPSKYDIVELPRNYTYNPYYGEHPDFLERQGSR